MFQDILHLLDSHVVGIVREDWRTRSAITFAT